MLIKILIGLILFLFLIFFILTIIIKIKHKKNKELEAVIEFYKDTYSELNCKYERLSKEIQIEKKHNAELAKKLSGISCMSIDDILSELQND